MLNKNLLTDSNTNSSRNMGKLNTSQNVSSVLSRQSGYKRKAHTKNHSSFLTLQNELFNSLNLNVPFKTKIPYKKLNYADYTEALNNSMVGYQTLTPRPNSPNSEKEEVKNPDERYITHEDELLIKKVYDSNRSYISKGLGPIPEDSMVKVSVKELEYRNPYQSVGLLKHNQVIFDEVSKNFLLRQKEKFDDSIKAFEGYTMKYKVKMPKIRVVASAPKVSFEIPVVDLVDDKKKKDMPALPPIPQNGLKLFAYYRYPNKNFPEGREQFSMCMCNGEVLLLGGMGSSMKQMSIWGLDIEKLEWTKKVTRNITNCRFGHTSNAYQNKIYVFGGRTKCNSVDVLANFDIYSFNENSWIIPNISNKNAPPLRRNHVSQMIGSQLLIHGGMGDNGEILGDCYLLNFVPLKWTSCSVNPYVPNPKLYGHTCSLVVPNDLLNNHRFSIYKYPDIGLNKITDTKIKEKGLYVFGGKSKEEGGISNDMWLLKLGMKPLEWVKLQTKGNPPSPRYFHTMNYYEKGNFLIIHGGRNDDLSDSFALSDTYVFDLENFDWLKVELYSHIHDFKILSRCGHGSVIICKYIF